MFIRLFFTSKEDIFNRLKINKIYHVPREGWTFTPVKKILEKMKLKIT